MFNGLTEAINAATGKRHGSATLGPGQFFRGACFLNAGRALMGRRAVVDTKLLCVPRAEMLKRMSEKRVASAVGEGSVVMLAVWGHIND